MISKIGPLVQVGKQMNLLVLHVLGGTLGGAAVGLVVGSVGIALEPHVPGTPQAGVAIGLPLVLLWTAASDLRLTSLPLLTTSWQTPGYWPCALGNAPASFAWGFHLGLGLATRIPHQALIALPLAAFLIGDLPLAIGLMAAYGSARGLAVAGAIVLSRSAHLNYAHTCDLIRKQKASVTFIVVVLALFIAYSGLTGSLVEK